jgi:hypothetical protein
LAVAATVVGVMFRANALEWRRFIHYGSPTGAELWTEVGTFLLALAVVLFAVLAHRWLSRGDKPSDSGPA